MSLARGGLPPEVPLWCGHFLVTVRERVRIFTPELQLCTRTGQGYNSAREAERRESEGRQVVSQFSYNRCEPSHVRAVYMQQINDVE